LGRGIVITCKNSMTVEAAEETDSFHKEFGLVGLDRLER
jgi:hypothetical protein